VSLESVSRRCNPGALCPDRRVINLEEAFMKRPRRITTMLCAGVSFVALLAIKPPIVEGQGTEGVLRRFSGLKLYYDLDLGAEQREALAGVAKELRLSTVSLREEAAKSRENLRRVFLYESLNEPAIRSAVREMAAIQEELAVIRASAFAKARTHLSSEQQDLLSQYAEELSGEVREKREQVDLLVDRWIESNTK